MHAVERYATRQRGLCAACARCQHTHKKNAHYTVPGKKNRKKPVVATVDLADLVVMFYILRSRPPRWMCTFFRTFTVVT